MRQADPGRANLFREQRDQHQRFDVSAPSYQAAGTQFPLQSQPLCALYTGRQGFCVNTACVVGELLQVSHLFAGLRLDPCLRGVGNIA